MYHNAGDPRPLVMGRLLNLVKSQINIQHQVSK